jgi:hypothetical protein
MADRKRKVEQAIKESVEMSAAPAPKAEAPAPLTPAQKLKSFTLNSREKAEAAAPEHPRAVKGRGFRQEELNAAVEKARQVRTRTDIESRTTTRGNVLTPEKIVGHVNKVRQGEKRVKAKPATPELVMDSSQIAPAPTKKPKPSKPKRMKKASTPQLRFKGE